MLCNIMNLMLAKIIELMSILTKTSEFVGNTLRFCRRRVSASSLLSWDCQAMLFVCFCFVWLRRFGSLARFSSLGLRFDLFRVGCLQHLHDDARTRRVDLDGCGERSPRVLEY